VIVTHNMQQAARVSDQTAFFNLAAKGKLGKLIEIGPTERSSPTRISRRPRTTSPEGLADACCAESGFVDLVIGPPNINSAP
jgi:hypothetical protein